MKNAKRYILSAAVALLAIMLAALIIYSVAQQRAIDAFNAARESESVEIYESLKYELDSVGTLKLFSPVGRDISPDEFVFYLGDETIKAEYTQNPDFSAKGEQSISLRVSIGGLSRDIKATLTLFEIVKKLSISYTDIENITIRDFVPNEKVDARFVGLSPSDISSESVGEYTFKIEVSGEIYEVVLSVIDDLPPEAKALEYTAYITESLPDPSKLVDSVYDISEVTVEYLSAVLYDGVGKYNYDILITDSSGNETTVSSVLNVIGEPTRSDEKIYVSSGSLPEDIVERIENVAKKYAGYDYGIYARDLKTGFVFSYNSETNIRAASTVKAPFAYYVCLELEKEDCPYTLDSLLEYTEEQYCIGEEGYINRMPYGSKFSVREILDANITLSDNSAYYMLHDYFGYKGYNELIKSLGVTVWLNGSNIKWGLYSPRELAIIWQEIYRYIESDGIYNELLRGLLIGAEYNFTKSALPHYSTVAHKSGFNNYSHCDAAIIYGESSTREIKPNDYVLSVMSTVNNADSNPNKALIAELTKIADDIMCSYQSY
ncbi:MAG: serine hydrolase [Clostridia bacterium]|nr:serine hydrolase [Clostridia bacterium]